MLDIGVVTFGYENKRECKRVAQRIITIGRQLQRHTHPLHFERLEASDYIYSEDYVKKEWAEKLRVLDGLIFVVPKDTRDIDDMITAAIESAEEELKYKTFLLIEYGPEIKHEDDLDIREVAHSAEMQVLYHTIDIPFNGSTAFPGIKVFEEIEETAMVELKKLFYWTMGSKYTRNLLTHLRV